MRKHIYLLALLFLPCIAFAQTNLPFTSLKPFNKGNFKIDVSYSRLQQKHPSHDYPDFRVGVGYGITNWCVVGIFGSFGTHESFILFRLSKSLEFSESTKVFLFLSHNLIAIKCYTL